jgi:hypothetical protein
VSFFDEPEDFSPSRATTAPRRSGGGGRGADRQTIRRRQMFGLGAGIVVLLLLFLLFKGCASIRKENSYKDYLREVAADMQQSQQESDAVFGLLRQPGDQSPVDLQNSINGFRSEAARLADRAKKRSVPGGMEGGHRYLVDTLEFRRDGIAAVARLLPTALGDQGAGTAVQRIAAQMRTFDASDVIYTTRYLPKLYSTIKKEGLAQDVPIPETLRTPKGFLPDIDWLRPTVVADRIARIKGGGTGTTAATPGLHGTGLVSVTVQPSGKQLTPSGTTDIPATKGLSFDVQVQNQGENDEKDVTVKLTISGAGKPITVSGQIQQIARGATATVSIPLPSLPPTGRPVTIKVSVAPVPGETKVDNNTQEYQAVFTAA